MHASAFSPRRQLSPQRRTPRSPFPPAACVDVQWRFLSPPSPADDSLARQRTVSLVDRLGSPQARADLNAEHRRQRALQDATKIHDQRVLYDLMGETQRQALLDQTMAEMKAMALSPVKSNAAQHHRHRRQQQQLSSPTTAQRWSVLQTREVELLPQRRLSALGEISGHQDEGWASTAEGSETSDEDAEGDGEGGGATGADDIPELQAIRDRQRRQQRRHSVDHPHEIRTPIRWQKSAHVCVAMDVPSALLQDDTLSAVISREESMMGNLFPLSEEFVREQHEQHSSPRHTNHKPKRSPAKALTHKQTAQKVLHPPLDFATSPRALRVKKADYGSWYVPRDEWGPLHDAHQETLAELFPSEQPLPTERRTDSRRICTRGRVCCIITGCLAARRDACARAKHEDESKCTDLEPSHIVRCITSISAGNQHYKGIQSQSHDRSTGQH